MHDTRMQMQQVQGHDGAVIAVEIGGDPAGPGVVLLHGGGQTRYAWGDAANVLVKKGYRVATYDLRGHGDSDWAPEGDYTLDTQVADLHAVTTLFRTAPALIGSSFGGLIALTAAGESPSCASALVLVDVTPKVDRDGEAKIIGFMRAYPSGFESVEQAANAISSYLPHRPRPRDLSGLQRNLRQHGNRWYWHWDPRLFDSLDVLGDTATARFERAARSIEIPTLLVRGTRSELVDEANAESFLALVPHARRTDMSDAHHMVAGDRNDAFNQAVLEFLGDIRLPIPEI